MLQQKPLITLTLDEARVFLEPAAAQALFGINIGLQLADGAVPLIEVLSTTERPLEFWGEYLAGLSVALLDVNRASPAAVARIPGLHPPQVDLLIKARPYISLDHLSLEGPDLKEIAQLAAGFLSHEGYSFLDKPQETPVRLIPTLRGIIVRYHAGEDPQTLSSLLDQTALKEAAHDQEDRYLVGQWDLPLIQRPSQLRALKESDLVETVAPFLQDSFGEIRLPYPDRLDLALHPGTDQEAWDELIERYALRAGQLYSDNYGPVHFNRVPHDLGALYRTLRELTREPAVYFAEPIYLVANIP